MKDTLSNINNFQSIVENISDKQTQTILKQVFSYMENKNLNQQININSPNSVMANNNAELRSIMVNNQLNNSSLTQLLDTFEQDLNSIIMPNKGKKEILDGIQELKTLIKNPSKNTNIITDTVNSIRLGITANISGTIANALLDLINNFLSKLFLIMFFAYVFSNFKQVT